MIDYLTSALATLLVVADPIFLSALFLGLTSSLSAQERTAKAMED
jgi:small neutral amino acid transporter SnatA (MarC family)